MFGISTFAQSPFASLGGAFFPFTITEDSGLADTNSQISAFLQAIAEPITMTDDNSPAALFVVGVTENNTLDDSSTQQSNFLQSLTEDSLLADVQEITAQFAQSVDENAVLNDDSTQYFAAQEVRLETIDAVLDSSTTQSNYNVARAENSNLSDVDDITAQFASSITEGISSEDSQAILAQFIASLSEATTIDDFEIIGSAFFFDVTEPFISENAETASLGASFFPVENINSNDSRVISAQFAASINELFAVASFAIVRGWVRIDDNQVPNWADISNTQGSGWTQVDDTQ